MPWIVTRQSYSSMGEDAYVVEVCGTATCKSVRDYCNPGALVAKYDGEFEVFDNPLTAANAAISILQDWRKDSPSVARKMSIRIGFTGGSTCPFEAPAHGAGIKEALQWGKDKYEKMDKCPQCGEIIGKERWTPADYTDESYCSERCAEKATEEIEKLNREETPA